MKSLMLINFFAVLTVMSACAQTNVPDAVKKAFNSNFMDSKSVKWDMEGDNEYEAEFKKDGHEMSANYNEKGEWLETETEMKMKDLPSAVLQTVMAQFDGYKAKEVAKVEKPDMKEAYEVEMKKGETTKEVLFSADGKIISQKNTEEDEDDEDN